MTFISYTHHQEDWLVYCLLEQVVAGRYVDVGAKNALDDSITRAFYERGWSGLNLIEGRQSLELYAVDRTRDTTLDLHAKASLVSTHATLEALAKQPLHFLSITGDLLGKRQPEDLGLLANAPWVIAIRQLSGNVINQSNWRNFLDAHYDSLWISRDWHIYLHHDYQHLASNLGKVAQGSRQCIFYKALNQQAQIEQMQIQARSLQALHQEILSQLHHNLAYSHLLRTELTKVEQALSSTIESHYLITKNRKRLLLQIMGNSKVALKKVGAQLCHQAQAQRTKLMVSIKDHLRPSLGPMYPALRKTWQTIIQAPKKCGPLFSWQLTERADIEVNDDSSSLQNATKIDPEKLPIEQRQLFMQLNTKRSSAKKRAT